MYCCFVPEWVIGGGSSDAETVFMSVWRNLDPLVFLSVHPIPLGCGLFTWLIVIVQAFFFLFIAMYMRDFERSCLVYWSCNSQLPSLRPSAEDRWSVTPGHRMKYPSTYLLYWVQVNVSMYCIFCICKWTSLPRLTLRPWWLVETLSWGPLECYTAA